MSLMNTYSVDERESVRINSEEELLLDDELELELSSSSLSRSGSTFTRA